MTIDEQDLLWIIVGGSLLAIFLIVLLSFAIKAVLRIRKRRRQRRLKPEDGQQPALATKDSENGSSTLPAVSGGRAGILRRDLEHGVLAASYANPHSRSRSQSVENAGTSQSHLAGTAAKILAANAAANANTRRLSFSQYNQTALEKRAPLRRQQSSVVESMNSRKSSILPSSSRLEHSESPVALGDRPPPPDLLPPHQGSAEVGVEPNNAPAPTNKNNLQLRPESAVAAIRTAAAEPCTAATSALTNIRPASGDTPTTTTATPNRNLEPLREEDRHPSKTQLIEEDLMGVPEELVPRDREAEYDQEQLEKRIIGPPPPPPALFQ